MYERCVGRGGVALLSSLSPEGLNNAGLSPPPCCWAKNKYTSDIF